MSSFAQLIDNDGGYRGTSDLPTRPRRIAVLQYTGGTTGLPKGAMLTHANLTAACQQYRGDGAATPPVLVEGEERVLAVLPPFHIYSLSVNMLLGILVGAELILHARFDPEAALKDIANKKITVFCGVPTMFTALLSHPGRRKDGPARRCKYCGSGGAPLPLEVAQRFDADHRLQAERRLGHDRDVADRNLHARASGAQGPAPAACRCRGIEIKFLDLGRPDAYVPLGETRRDLHQGPERDEGLLEEARRDRRRRRRRTDSCAPATSATWTRTASSSSSTGPRTCCCAAASTSIRATSRRRSTSTRRSPK